VQGRGQDSLPLRKSRTILHDKLMPQHVAATAKVTASAFTTQPASATAKPATSAIESEPKPFDSVIVAVVPLDERELQVLLLQGKLLLTIACRVLLCEQLQFLRTGRLPFEVLGRVSF